MNACYEIKIGDAEVYSEDVVTFNYNFAQRSADVTRQTNQFTLRHESLAIELRLNADRFFSSLDTEERDAESR
jgi:hypothetical protein